jgi:CPA2 family monovalent cation:H+ antiporter-2
VHESESIPFLREILLFLALAGLLMPLLERLRINQVVGFLAAGTLLGPFGLARLVSEAPWLASFTFAETAGVHVLAELGVMFLMFMIGLELSTERLWAMRRWVFGAGLVQWLASGLLLGLAAWALGYGRATALVLGLVLALSSTAVVMQLLSEQRTLGTRLGQASFSVLMLQDLAVVPLLILVGVLAPADPSAAPAAHGLGSVAGAMALSLVKAAVAVLLIGWAGRKLIRPLFRAVSRHRKPDVFMALTLLATLSIAALTAAAGLSMALGALLAGLLLAETEFRHEVEVTIEPFRGLLMGLFFMSVGMGIDPLAVVRDPLWLLLSVVGLFAIKGFVVAAIFRAGGLSAGKAIEGGLLLGQGGEFAFIVIGAAMMSGLLPAQDGQAMLLVVGLSLFVTPLLARLGGALGERIDARSRDGAARADDVEGLPEAGERSGHVVIAGFGRVGHALASVLDAQRVPYVAFESDAGRVASQRAAGMPVWFGNATRADLLQKVNATEAAAIVLTMDQPAAALHALQAIRQFCPSVPVIARSRDEAHAAVLRAAGATVVIPETLEASLQIASYVLQASGLSEAHASAAVDAERERRIDAMRAPR